jgi:hypothetical protein
MIRIHTIIIKKFYIIQINAYRTYTYPLNDITFLFIRMWYRAVLSKPAIF